MCLSNSRRVCTTSSAAAEGVDARTSATKSVMVKSVSWPTPEITGISESAMARATISSLKAHKSSSEPPPRANQHVHKLLGIEKLQRFDDFLGSAFALYAHRKNREMHVGKSARKDAHDVADGSATRRSDQADAAGKKRQRLFARGIEEAFGFEALFQLIER